MTTLAPMMYSTTVAPPVAYSTAAPYVAGPVYAAVPQMSVPIPLTPMVMMPESLLVEDNIGETGLTKLLKKVIALPLAIVLPIVIPLIVIIKYLVGGGTFLGKKTFFSTATEMPFVQQTTPFFVNATDMPTTPYYGPQGFYSGPESFQYGGGAGGAAGSAGQPWQRQRRDAGNSSSSSSGLPSMSLAQIERLTQVVFAAMRSQECIQRLLCEIGSMSKSFSDTAHSVTLAVESFVPESIKASYDVFAKAEKCEQYVCGTLQVKK
jgi:hypothetical protein